jgi:leucyl/phenylalanyl-tRNA--protein transferase
MATGWVRYAHRGVQYLDQLQFPSGRKRYVYNSRFQLRINHAFDEVVRACANIQRPLSQGHEGKSWISPELIAGLVRLHQMGYAHSYEAWSEGRLAGGTFGIQLGGLHTLNSLFHNVAQASKFALGQAFFHLRDRGFRCVDIGMPPDHQLNFGAQWIPRWKFEAELPALLRQQVSIADDWPCRPVPWALRLGLPAARVYRAVQRRWDGIFAS